MYKLLRITQIGDVKESSNKRKYRQVWFRPVTLLPNGQSVYTNTDSMSRVVFDAFTDGEKTFKADGVFASIKAGELKQGDYVEGTIMRFDTTPYRIDTSERDLTSYRTVVFSGESPVDYANKQLKSNYACVVDEFGNATLPEQCDKPVTVNN